MGDISNSEKTTTSNSEGMANEYLHLAFLSSLDSIQPHDLLTLSIRYGSLYSIYFQLASGLLC